MPRERKKADKEGLGSDHPAAPRNFNDYLQPTPSSDRVEMLEDARGMARQNWSLTFPSAALQLALCFTLQLTDHPSLL